ncbi:hypothetical protein LO763_20020 [Glycomyces sp. A-F 0318]|uniref:hypothetical protein n=1 Tax=Glycomyces amatae TaxID=2881355 RepID=UPI001E427473|nr:hypothetical protein [Glycomyces amatae]MCD0445901.1 hypothetical protein [Glycomyces amatae]
MTGAVDNGLIARDLTGWMHDAMQGLVFLGEPINTDSLHFRVVGRAPTSAATTAP